MAKDIIYLETGTTDPYYNLAFEEYVLEHYTEGDIVILWQNDNSIIIGQNQNTEAEINRACVEERKINVVRRATGGGAVYHDLGNLNYSFITDAGDMEALTKTPFAQAVIDALSDLGVEATSSGRNDILIDGRKVSGTAQRIRRNRILYHGTLLFDADLTVVADALKVDPLKFQTKAVQSVRSRVGNIRPMLKKDMTILEFKESIRRSLVGNQAETTQLSQAELAEVQKLSDDKYRTYEWNYGRTKSYGITNKRRFPGGIIEPRMTIQSGCIEDIIFYGDFLSLDSLEELTEALKGCRFRREDVAEVMSHYDLSRFFGAITEDQVLDTMFNLSE